MTTEPKDTKATGPVVLSTSHQPRRDVTVLAALEQYWRGLRSAGGLPRRVDIDPACIDGALPYTFIAESVAPGVARLRVAGRHLNDMAAMDVRGMPLSALFSADARPALAEAISALLEGPALVDMPIQLPRTLLRRGQNGRLLMMPLLDDRGNVTRILGAVVMDGLVQGRGPLKLGIAEGGAIRVEPVSMMDEPAVRRAEARPALRLVVNNG
ncbi:PAS domain-containing protein [Flavimaricola marinus]|uniref:PAS domain protein n=1 Tax=Flavimaricola marinus TaxID=1819565 RepID=A0A238LEM0_9RHOB|nr:PAS domain-containing protein [Flavimaricola marinus]SMY07406.1 PAS domain protein [Flavimaricola marinus]